MGVVDVRVLEFGIAMSEIRLNFHLTTADVFFALVNQMVKRMWFLLPLPVMSVVSIVWGVADPGNGVVSGFFLLGAPYWQARTAMKNPNFGGTVALRFSEQGIEFTGAAFWAADERGWKRSATALSRAGRWRFH